MFRYYEFVIVIFHPDHLKAHCGVTDFMCNLCNKPFTTLPVLRRHIKTCEKKKTFSEGIALNSLTL